MIVPEADVKFHRFLCAIFYEQLFRYAMNQPAPGDGAIYFLLDEFASLGRIPDFEMIAACLRKRRVSLSLICQDTSQIVATYGASGASTIINGACSSKLFLPGLSLQTCQEIERILGKRTIKIDERREMGRALLTADEIKRLPDNRALYVFANQKPALLKTVPYYKNRKLLKRTRIPPPPLPATDDGPVEYLKL